MLSSALILALGTIAVLIPCAMRPLSYAGQQPLIDRTEKLRARRFKEMHADIPASFPLVMKIRDRTCVELRAAGRARTGSYSVCYNR